MNSNAMGLFISEIRKKKNLTQRELAEKIGVTSKAVSKQKFSLIYIKSYFIYHNH